MSESDKQKKTENEQPKEVVPGNDQEMKDEEAKQSNPHPTDGATAGEDDAATNGEDVEFIDDELIEQMDDFEEDGLDGESDDFKTMKESEIGEDQYNELNEGDVIDLNQILVNDAICSMSLLHQDHVYSVTQVPREPYDTFLSGDGNDKCYVWKVITRDGTKQCIKVGELEGHTETVEFIKFNFDGKLCLTGGMNNILRIWSVEAVPDCKQDESSFVFKLKTKLENGPSENDDILVVDWHPKGNAVLCGGKDYTLYLMNGATGEFLACFSGHEEEILCAQFTPNGGKLIVSSSADLSIRVWSPIKQECQTVIKAMNNFHKASINTFALHEQR